MNGRAAKKNIKTKRKKIEQKVVRYTKGQVGIEGKYRAKL